MAKEVVLAFFPDEAAADAAVAELKDWEKLQREATLRAVGVLVLDEHGDVKQHRLGRHDTGKGAGVGFILGIIGVALTPIAGVGLVGWTIGGAVVGRMAHKHLGLKDEDLQRIGYELKGGKAAVGVLVEQGESPDVIAKLEDLGGVVEAHLVEDDDDLADAAADAQAAADAAGAPVPADGGAPAAG
ncbi:MAG: DUF1269 domain-containing protein [Chloroflexi bacterium]|jgi:uncharacterized membrane protein|nr:DUF1269 domain-containing protein [Chloroflexota bacterium]